MPWRGRKPTPEQPKKSPSKKEADNNSKPKTPTQKPKKRKMFS